MLMEKKIGKWGEKETEPKVKFSHFEILQTVKWKNIIALELDGFFYARNYVYQCTARYLVIP